MMKILEMPLFYQLSTFLTTDLKKTRSIIACEFASNSGKTLDICCGTGNFAMVATGEYSGFDLNEKYIEFAKRRFREDPAKHFFIGDIDKIQFGPERFDNVFMISTLHHFSDSQADNLISKISNIATGKIIITDPSIETKNLVSKFLISLDRGAYMRSEEEEVKLVSKHLDVERVVTFQSRLAAIRMLICKPRNA